MAEPLELVIVAGEASGDAHGAALVRALDQIRPGTIWRGAAGPQMREAGVEAVVASETLSVVGIGEVIAHLPTLWRAMGLLKETLRRRPACLVLVDYPDFNFRLARFANRLGIPVAYYIPPQVWAWRQSRTKFLKRYVSRVFTLFPFEEEFLTSRGVDARFVGHPLVDTAKPPSSLPEFLSRHGLDPSSLRVALLPGSRRSEVERNLPILADTATLLCRWLPGTHCLVPWAPSLPKELRTPYAHAPIRWVEGQYLDVLGHADAAAVASGTATLEAALMGIPQVIVYRVKPVTYWIGKRLVKLPFVGLPNVVVGRGAVTELIQQEFSSEALAHQLGLLLEAGEKGKANAVALGAEIRKRLGEGDASTRAALELNRLLEEEVRPL